MSELRRAAAHVFVEDLFHPELGVEDAHHLNRVLRLRSGEIVTVCDGHGSWRVCAVVSKQILEPVDDLIHRSEPRSRPISVAFGIPKSDKPETVVQKLTELGVDRILPVLLDHCVVRWDEAKIDRMIDRFEKVAREAAMQSRQVFRPVVSRVTPDLETLLGVPEIARQGGAVALTDPQGDANLEGISTLVVGPEGGFSDRELAAIDRWVRLPGGILRSETAAIAAGVLLARARDQQ